MSRANPYHHFPPLFFPLSSFGFWKRQIPFSSNQSHALMIRLKALRQTLTASPFLIMWHNRFGGAGDGCFSTCQRGAGARVIETEHMGQCDMGVSCTPGMQPNATSPMSHRSVVMQSSATLRPQWVCLAGGFSCIGGSVERLHGNWCILAGLRRNIMYPSVRPLPPWAPLLPAACRRQCYYWVTSDLFIVNQSIWNPCPISRNVGVSWWWILVFKY